MTSRANPFVGPRSLSGDDKIFGRGRETAEVVDLLIAERILLLYSPSGAGKTSLVNAALIPALKDRGFRVHPVIRPGFELPPDALPDPGAQPNGTSRFLLSSLSCLQEEGTLTDSQQVERRSITDFLGEASDDDLLIFDQLEEVLTIDPVNRAAKEEFFAQVGAALRRENCWALFAMREDHIAALDPYRRLIPTRFKNTYRLDLLGVEAAMEAMDRPATLAGVPFATQAARQLADDLRRVRIQLPDGSTEQQLGPQIEPLHLQVVCRRLWERLPEDAESIEARDVERAGEVDTALAGYYAATCGLVARESGISERAIRDWMERRLITPQGIRGQVLQGKGASEGLDNRAIQKLVDTHLVRAEPRRGATWFELAHDRLVDPIRQDNARWREANLSSVQRRAALWEQQNRAESLLVTHEELRDALAWAASQTALTGTEREFIHESERAQKRIEKDLRQQRLIRWLALAATIVSILAVGAALYAKRQTGLALSREAAARSMSVTVPSDRLALARQAWAFAKTDQAAEALELAFQTRTGPQFIGHTEPVNSLSMNRNGSSMVTAGDDGLVNLWDTRTRQHPSPWQLDGKALCAVFNPDGTRIAVGGADGLRVLEVSSRKDILKIPGGAVSAVAFSDDGQYLASGGDDKEVRIWGPLRSPSSTAAAMPHPAPIRGLAFLDADRLLAASADGSIIVWNWKTASRVKILTGNSEPLNAIAFNARARLIAAATTEGSVLLWHSDSYAAAGALPHGSRGVSAVAFSFDGARLASGSRGEGNVKVWDIRRRTTVMRLLQVAQEQVNALAFFPSDNERLAVAADSAVRLYDLNVTRLDAHDGDALRK